MKAEARADHLVLRGVGKSYGATRALDNASLDVARGTIHALVGGNGSGKSTLIKVLAGVVRADSGDLTLGSVNQSLTSHSSSRARELGLFFVHQQSSTFPELSVAENLSIGRGYETGFGKRIRWVEVKRRTERVLERFDILARPDDLVGVLSSANQMMIAIARALQDQDEKPGGVLVLDEPTASLPRHEVDQLLASLKRLAGEGHTIVYVTHRLEEVMLVADAGTVLRDGQTTDTFVPGEVDHDELVTMIMGRPIERTVARTLVPQAEVGEPLLTATGLGNGDCDLTVRSGEIVGVAGILGSGRSRLLRQLFGATSHGGTVEVNGSAIDVRTPRDAMRAGIAYVPDDRPNDAMFPGLSISENLSLGALESHSRLGRISAGSERRAARELSERFHVRSSSELAPVGSLSGGNQQKVILARWLQRNPKVLLLDEPTQGVDVGARAEIHGMVRSAVKDGAGALIVSSDFEELAAACDRVLVMRNGRMCGELAGDDLDEERLNSLVYLKEAA